MRFLRNLFRRRAPEQAFTSTDYWRDRYEVGGNSGAGSYGRLAAYKADIVNALVRDKGVKSVIEFGSGDGNQCSLLTVDVYTGVDISERVVEACRARFADRQGWRFLSDAEFRVTPVRADLSMSLDVIYHLIEDQVFERYMTDLFGASSRFVLVYSSDHDAATNAQHVRHRAYSSWVQSFAPEFTLVKTFEHPFPMADGADKKNTSFAAFKLFERAAQGRVQ